jgi:hypothetical protein
MTEDKRREQNIKLRRLRQADKDTIASLQRLVTSQHTRIGELVIALELAKTEAATRRDTYALLCQGLGAARKA